MDLPKLNCEDVQYLFSDLTEVSDPLKGGFKLVFPCKSKDDAFALKFIKLNLEGDEQDQQIQLDEIEGRIKREVDILAKCESEYVTKLGPIPLHTLSYKSQNLLCYSEVFYSGRDLDYHIKLRTSFSVSELLDLGLHMADAISHLWAFSKLHRDIKPGNIIFCKDLNKFILLDMGIALDLSGPSFTKAGFFPGTERYISPDQLDISQKRNLDFRADLFCLGIVLYEVATLHHPFRTKDSMGSHDWFHAILHHTPTHPRTYRSDLPDELSGLFLRLLSKQKHQRYRSCEILIEKLNEIRESL